MSDRRQYSKAFKLEAIRQYESGRSEREIEQELGITKGLVWKWRQSLAKSEKAEEAFPGHGNMSGSEARIRELERENASLREDKEILKKVLKLYSREGQ